MALARRREHRAMSRSFDAAMEEQLDRDARGAIGRLLFYKRHRTLNRLASIYRESLDRVGHQRYPGAAQRPEARGVTSLLLSGNAAGEIPIEMVDRGLETLVVRAYRNDCELRLTMLSLAIQIHQLRHGVLPSTLDDLVPEILPQLPLDPFSGRSFRYRRNPDRVYSVGPNGEDDGGENVDDIFQWLYYESDADTD